MLARTFGGVGLGSWVDSDAEDSDQPARRDTGAHSVSGVDGVRTCDARNAADALEGATRTTAGVLSMEPWLRQALPNLTDRPGKP